MREADAFLVRSERYDRLKLVSSFVREAHPLYARGSPIICDGAFFSLPEGHGNLNESDRDHELQFKSENVVLGFELLPFIREGHGQGDGPRRWAKAMRYRFLFRIALFPAELERVAFSFALNLS